MSEKGHPVVMARSVASLPSTRLIISVDGTSRPNGVHTSISRLHDSIRTGVIPGDNLQPSFNQITKYYAGFGLADDLIPKETATVLGRSAYQKQIQDIYELCCTLEGDKDEVWLFGYSRGAYVVRAVAGLLHNFGAIISTDQASFAKQYKQIQKQVDASQLVSGTDLAEVRSSSSIGLRPPPKVRFVGAFDTIKPGSEQYDISLSSSICHMRHALALHEDRKALYPEILNPEEFYGLQLKNVGRSFVQAWFIGSHTDMGGTSSKGGLGLYPLQWMLLEARGLGLSIDFDHSSLVIVFPRAEIPRRNANLWSCTTENGVKVTMQDITEIHEHPRFSGKYAVKMNSPSRTATLRARRAREAFGPSGYLVGYCDHAPQGTIIHPSVYLLVDEHMNVALETKEVKLQRNIEDWREKMLGTQDGVLNMGFWGHEDDNDLLNPGAIRVLVCGNTGVGKSTLINKTFGVDVTQSSDRARGIHDVREEITFEGRPDLIVHDSGGFEAGTSSEFEAIEEFLKTKSTAIEIKDRLHVIWFCVDINSARTLQTATEKLFQAVSKYANDVPIVIVTTKKDDFLDLNFSAKRKELKKQNRRFDEELCEEYAEEKLQERVQMIKEELESVAGGRLDAIVAVSSDDSNSIAQLTTTTSRCFDIDKVRLLYVRAQVTRTDLKVDLALNEVMRRYRILVRAATGWAYAPMGSTIGRRTQLNRICKCIVNCFGLPSVNAETAIDVLKNNVWNTLGSNTMLALAEGLHTLSYIATGFMSGIPMWAITGSLNVALIVPATCRLFLTFSCDLILVLARSFKEVAFREAGQPTEKDVMMAARNYQVRGYVAHVHRDVKKILPRRGVGACYKIDAVKTRFEEVINRYKDKLLEDVALPLAAKAIAVDDEFDDISTIAESAVSDADSVFIQDMEQAQTALAGLAELDGRSAATELPTGPMATELAAEEKPRAELEAPLADQKTRPELEDTAVVTSTIKSDGLYAPVQRIRNMGI